MTGYKGAGGGVTGDGLKVQRTEVKSVNLRVLNNYSYALT